MQYTQALKQVLKDAPGVKTYLKHRYDDYFEANVHAEQLYRGIFDSYEAALVSAPKGPRGYDNPKSAEMYRGLMRRVEDYDWPVLFWLEQRCLPSRA